MQHLKNPLRLAAAAVATVAAAVIVAGCADGSNGNPDIVECIPTCAEGQECGGDGCGGFCGTPDGMCADGLKCDGMSCIANPCPAGFVLVPAWTYRMGSPDNEPGRVTGGGDETLHKVTISKPFCMAETEVTNAEWAAVTATTPSYFKDAGDNVAVQNINWYDAIKFLNMKSVGDELTPCYLTDMESGTHGGGCVTGQIQCNGDFHFGSVSRVPGCTGYRLPTEAEWELAARAGHDTDPDEFEGLQPAQGLQCQSPNPRLDPFAWYCGNAAATYESAYDCRDWSPLETCGPQPVARKDPNAWGLYDMLGNVFEFTQDQYWWHTADPQTDPLLDDENGYNRVIRGGSWSAAAAFARVASRAAMGPTDRGDVGLRPVIDPPTSALGPMIQARLAAGLDGTDDSARTNRIAPAAGNMAPETSGRSSTDGSGAEAAMPEPAPGAEDQEQEVVFAGPTYRVVSFNLMCSVCGAGYDDWEERLVYFGDMFETIQADLIGIQEIVFDFEVDQLLAELPGYAAYFYKGDGADFFAYPDATVLYRTDRFELLDQGEYWLSPTPDVPWSMGYSPGQSIPRVVAWVKLRDRTTSQVVYFATTHYDSTHPHQEHSAPQMIRTVEQWAVEAPVIQTGDFNTEPRDPAFNILTNGIDATGFHMDDTFATVGNYWNSDVNTPKNPPYDPINRIDHIFTAGADFSTKFWWVDLRKFGPDTLYPSDHRLIWAEIVMNGPY
ncbi:MAG TPA: SUMF1/EgtB/PvdO family nonheme iron enzyme [Myxococcota bacterium]|nr:SUMF1/EgtB/PvdO family nonheme iron enzyme [Myxococcota bacterium]